MISIIVPAYNSEKYIGECIESVINQDFDDFELIIINDCSIDTTLNIIKSYAHPKIKVYSNSINSGEGKTRNVGIDIARGDYVLFLDSDDKLFQGALKYIDCCIKKYRFDLMTYPLISNKKVKIRKARLLRKDHALKMFLCYRKLSGFAGGKVIRKDIIGDDRFNKIRIGEDGDFMFRMYCKSNKIVYTEHPIYYYRIHNESASEHTFFSEKMLDGVKNLPQMYSYAVEYGCHSFLPWCDVFAFRVLYSRIEKMIRTNAVEEYASYFQDFCGKIDIIRYKIFIYTIPWNVKNIYFLLKYERYKRIGYSIIAKTKPK